MHEDVFNTMVSGEHDESVKREVRMEMEVNDAKNQFPYTISTENWIYTIKRAIDKNGVDHTDEFGTQYDAVQKHK